MPATSEEPTTVRVNVAARRVEHWCWDNDEIQDFVNEILDKTPDDWDGDDSAESIAIDFVNHLVEEVKRLGGCLKPHCWDREPGEWPGPCDHGYR